MVDGFTFRRQPTGNSVVEVLDLLDRVRARISSTLSLRGDASGAAVERDRFSQEWTTPRFPRKLLLARLTAGASSLYDPACGEGGVLLMAAVIGGGSDSSSTYRLVGRDMKV